MRKVLLLALILSFVALVLSILLVARAASAQEVATLTTPILAQGGISALRPADLRISVQYGQIDIILKEFVAGEFVEGRTFTVTYDATGSRSSAGTTTTEADAGQSLIRLLNRANFSVNSLEKLILQRLMKDKHLNGSVTGTPQ